MLRMQKQLPLKKGLLLIFKSRNPKLNEKPEDGKDLLSSKWNKIAFCCEESSAAYSLISCC